LHWIPADRILACAGTYDKWRPIRLFAATISIPGETVTTSKNDTEPILDRLHEQIHAQPEDADAHYRLALVLLNPAEPERPPREQTSRALKRLEYAVELRAGFAGAHALIAYAQLELEDPDAAVLSLRRAIELEPDNEIYRDFLLETLDRAGRHRELEECLENAAVLRQTDLDQLRDELVAAGMPTDPSTLRLNAFPAGERHFVSDMFDVIEAIERAQDLAGSNNSNCE